MKREDMIRMAREAGWQYAHGDSGYEPLWAFAALVAEHEREECIKFCDEVAQYFPSSGFVGSYIGSKIKARGQA